MAGEPPPYTARDEDPKNTWDRAGKAKVAASINGDIPSSRLLRLRDDCFLCCVRTKFETEIREQQVGGWVGGGGGAGRSREERYTAGEKSCVVARPRCFVRYEGRTRFSTSTLTRTQSGSYVV